jgi:hypothetical protein
MLRAGSFEHYIDTLSRDDDIILVLQYKVIRNDSEP